MEINGKDVYFIAVKALLRDGDKLLVTHDIYDQWDLPGGRLKKDEFRADFRDVLARKIREELGDDVRYLVDENPSVFFRVERTEHLETGGEIPARIFGLGFEAAYEGGEIKLGEHHDKAEWFDTNGFEPEKYLTGGWEVGVREYIEREKHRK
jgi:8-oxo-dGTP pyrophosphatase MutT (NUDIX family)